MQVSNKMKLKKNAKRICDKQLRQSDKRCC